MQKVVSSILALDIFSEFFRASGMLSNLVRKRGIFSLSPLKAAILPFKIPDIGEGITEVQLMEWFVKEGQSVDEMDKLCLVESDKAAVEITSRFKGMVSKLKFKQFDKVKIGSVILEIDDGKEAGQVTQPVPEIRIEPVKPTGKRSPEREGGNILPQLRALARDLGVDLTSVVGSGKNGRITKEDIESASPTKQQVSVKGVKTVTLTGIQSAMAKAMHESSSVPHLTLGEEIRVDSLMDSIAEFKSISQERYQLRTVTVTALLVKALSLSLADFPFLNSKFHSSNGNEFHVDVFDDHNISVAVQSDKGLVVPNLKQVQNKSIVDIQRDLFAIQERAQKGRLTLEDVKGGTASLSNVGVIGGTYARPVLFGGQALIGAVGRIRTLPRYEDNELQPHRILNMSWSADHRHLSGADVALFSNRFKELVERPELMLLYLH